MILRRWLIPLGLLFIWGAACGQTTNRPQATQFSVTVFPTLLLAPSPLPSFTPSPLPARTATASPTPTIVPCDAAVGYCIYPGHFVFQRPIVPPADENIDPTYRYGSTRGGTLQPHHGVEFYNASGTPVLAALGGTVVVAGNDRQTLFSPRADFYGNLIVIQHHVEGIVPVVFTLYAHLSQIDVVVGQIVSVGEEIGEVGASGSALGSHLHFEVRLGENTYTVNRNPELWLIPHPGHGALAGRISDSQGNPIHGNVNVQYYPDPAAPAALTSLVETYIPELEPVGNDDIWHETFALGDLPAGRYRLSLVTDGKLFERWVDVQPAQVTLVILVIK